MTLRDRTVVVAGVVAGILFGLGGWLIIRMTPVAWLPIGLVFAGAAVRAGQLIHETNSMRWVKGLVGGRSKGGERPITPIDDTRPSTDSSGQIARAEAGFEPYIIAGRDRTAPIPQDEAVSQDEAVLKDDDVPRDDDVPDDPRELLGDPWGPRAFLEVIPGSDRVLVPMGWGSELVSKGPPVAALHQDRLGFWSIRWLWVLVLIPLAPVGLVLLVAWLMARVERVVPQTSTTPQDPPSQLATAADFAALRSEMSDQAKRSAQLAWMLCWIGVALGLVVTLVGAWLFPVLQSWWVTVQVAPTSNPTSIPT